MATVKIEDRELKDGRTSYRLVYRDKGNRWVEVLSIYLYPIPKGTPLHTQKQIKQKNKETKELVESIRRNKEVELNAQGTGFIPSHIRKVKAIDYFTSYADGYQKKDIRRVRAVVNRFKEFSESDSVLKKIKLVNLTRSHCESFKDSLCDHLDGETPHNYFGTFKKILKKAVEDKMLDKSPAEGIKNPKRANIFKKEVLFQHEDEGYEITKLLGAECGNNEVKRAFIFACYTGLGNEDCKRLKWGNIKNGRVIAKRAKLEYLSDLEDVDTKLHPMAEKALFDWGKKERGKASENIFKLPSTNGINDVLQNWVDRAGIDRKITFYCGRHTFAVMLLMHGANLKTIADCLGHSKTEHTYKYLNFVKAMKNKAIDSLPDAN